MSGEIISTLAFQLNRCLLITFNVEFYTSVAWKQLWEWGRVKIKFTPFPTVLSACIVMSLILWSVLVTKKSPEFLGGMGSEERCCSCSIGKYKGNECGAWWTRGNQLRLPFQEVFYPGIGSLKIDGPSDIPIYFGPLEQHFGTGERLRLLCHWLQL